MYSNIDLHKEDRHMSKHGIIALGICAVMALMIGILVIVVKQHAREVFQWLFDHQLIM